VLACILAFLGTDFGLLAQEPVSEAVRTEYDKRVRTIFDEMNKERLVLIRQLGKTRMDAWARLECAKLLSVDPSNEEATGVLKELRTVNEGVAEDWLVKRAENYQDAQNRIARSAARRHVSLARWCREQKLGDAAREHLMAAQALDPIGVDVVAALGFKTSAILPIPSSPETIEILRSFREDVGKVPLGEVKKPKDGWGPPEIKEKLTVVLGRHVGVESDWMSEEWLRELARQGDWACEVASRLLGMKLEGTESRYWFMYGNDDHFREFVIWLHPNRKAESIKHLLDLYGMRSEHDGYSISRFVHEEVPIHKMNHMVCQFAIFRAILSRGREDSRESAWISEGFAIMMEYAGSGSNLSWCVSAPDTRSSGGDRKEFRTAAAECARLVKDPPFVNLAKAGFSTLAIQGFGAAKAASVMEWLFARDRAGAVEFIREMAAPNADTAAVIRKRFGWCPEEFDEHWRRWAIAIDKATSGNR
jgi:hypothetical protein